MSIPFGNIMFASATLALVTGLILLAARAVRLTGLMRFTVPNGTRRLVVQDTLALDRVRKLIVVRCDGTDLLVLTGPASETVVGWLPARESGADLTAAPVP